MLFSGKISNSFLAFLQSHGAERDEFYDLTDLPMEFLKDPNSWLDAQKLEILLDHIERYCLNELDIAEPICHIGHKAKDLKAWGVLDSVLSMIEKPQDIFMQPQRFISYFVSPAPPIANIQRGPAIVSFELPISFEEYPHVTTYLRAAMEAIPMYMGQSMAEAKWQQNRLTVNWEVAQAGFADSNLERRQMAPEVVQNLISNLEKTERALLEKTREIEKIKSENLLAARSQPQAIEDLAQFHKKFGHFEQQILRLQDYFTRSQQLITILVGQDRLSGQVREAMRRVNWEHVQSSFPKVTQELLSDLEQPSGKAP